MSERKSTLKSPPEGQEGQEGEDGAPPAARASTTAAPRASTAPRTSTAPRASAMQPLRTSTAGAPRTSTAPTPRASAVAPRTSTAPTPRASAAVPRTSTAPVAASAARKSAAGPPARPSATGLPGARKSTSTTEPQRKSTMDPLKGQAMGRAAEIIQLLESEDEKALKGLEGKAALQWAVENDNGELVRRLLEAEVSVHVEYDADEGSLLHRTRSLGVLQQLVLAGADVNAQDIDANTPLLHVLDSFKQKEKEPAAIFLLRCGADPELRGRNGENMLYKATTLGSVELVRLALAHGVDPNVRVVEHDSSVQGSHPIHVAATTSPGWYNADAQDDVPILTMIISAGANVDARDDAGQNALHWAARFGCAWAIRALLKAGADVKAKTVRGRSPLHLAAAMLNQEADVQGKEDCIVMLMEYGLEALDEDDNAKSVLSLAPASLKDVLTEAGHKRTKPTDEDKQMALLRAARDGQEDEVKGMLEGLDVGYRRGTTALMEASARGYVNIVDALLAAGADVAATSERHRRTALHFAARNDHYAAVASLMAKGAQSDAKDDQGREALHMAAAFPRSLEATTVLSQLLRYGAVLGTKDDKGRTALQLAAGTERASAVATLLAKGADANNVDSEGWTVLHTAAAAGSARAVSSLLTSGAKKVINTPDTNGWTPLHCVAWHCPAGDNANETARLLLEAGANAEAKTTLLQATPSHLALLKSSFDVAQQTLKAATAAGGKSPKDVLGRMPLQCAAWRAPRPEVLQKVLEAQRMLTTLVSADETTVDRRTSLHFAAASTRDPPGAVLRWLIDRGAYIDARTADGRTPLHLAAARHRVDAVLLLLQKGADLKARCDRGRTALHWAVRCACPEVEAAMLKHGATLMTDRGPRRRPWLGRDKAADLALMLLRRGIDVTVRDNRGLTALDSIHEPFQAPRRTLVEEQ